ncbi:mechanosensitive ion channel family protein [Allocoleopsis franciscana]|uniref:Small-conductance mechanosensitive channel n=1 Tax=Allocoleopsis franciscana PCC 7113 TaxID=1173027 RepID=K9WPH6_9CYAN|nr:mechanosensitive ion channel family protein [Allocoleopsis franciscana]AFZ21711.1 small-conductance mechanosensitive channel [Allocoleopsis franciscana PCC 7113]
MMQWILPLALILGSLLAGLIFERFFLKKIKKLAARTDFFGYELIFEALHRKTLIWFFLGGLYAALLTVPLAPAISTLLQKIIAIVFLYTATLFLAKLAGDFVCLAGQKSKGGLPASSLLNNSVKTLVFVFGILMILQALGIPITPIIATLGIGSLAVALAFQDTLANLYAGLFLIISKQVKPNDYIKLTTGEEGYVTDITWRNTTIKELPNNLIIVPNKNLASAIFKNYHLPAKEIVFQVPVGVSYESDLDQIEQVTLNVAQEVMENVPGGVPEFKPFILYQEFGEFSINFTVFLRINEFFDQRLVKHEFIKRLHKRYREEGIEIPFPTRITYFKDFQQPKVENPTTGQTLKSWDS